MQSDTLDWIETGEIQMKPGVCGWFYSSHSLGFVKCTTIWPDVNVGKVECWNSSHDHGRSSVHLKRQSKNFKMQSPEVCEKGLHRVQFGLNPFCHQMGSSHQLLSSGQQRIYGPDYKGLSGSANRDQGSSASMLDVTDCSAIHASLPSQVSPTNPLPHCRLSQIQIPAICCCLGLLQSSPCLQRTGRLQLLYDKLPPINVWIACFLKVYNQLVWVV